MVVEQFVEIAHRIVYCTLSTVDEHGRPRSRLVHPVWQLTARARATPSRPSPVGCSPGPTPAEAGHLRRSPFVSCSYWDPVHDVAVAECAAEWVTDPAERAGVWSVVATAAPPVGWDPSTIFAGGVGDPGAGILRLTPWRLSSNRVADIAAGRPGAVWRAPAGVTSCRMPVPG
jgi:hypothetical protein